MSFANSVAQVMPGYGSGSNYVYAVSALTATGTLTIAATTTTPSTNGIPFNANGGPAPSRGKIRLRATSVNGATTLAALLTVTDGTNTLQIESIGTTAAGTGLDYTKEFNTDLSITSVSAVVTLAGGTQAATMELEVSMN